MNLKSKEERKILVEQFKDIKKIVGVFQVKNIVTEKTYVMSNLNVNAKIKAIKFEMEAGTSFSKDLLEDWKKYGEENFVFEILEEIDMEKYTGINIKRTLKELEKKWQEN